MRRAGDTVTIKYIYGYYRISLSAGDITMEKRKFCQGRYSDILKLKSYVFNICLLCEFAARTPYAKQSLNDILETL